MAVNEKRDQDVICNEMREDSKEERETKPDLLELKASGILESIVNKFY